MSAEEKKRIAGLQEFQIQVIEKAMTFQKVHKISYSTCSLYTMENEQVVKLVLERHPEFELDHLRKKKQLACLNPGFREELE